MTRQDQPSPAWKTPVLGSDAGVRESPDIEGFQRVTADYRACEIGHLSGLAYMADRTDEHATSRCIHPQIDDVSISYR